MVRHFSTLNTQYTITDDYDGIAEPRFLVKFMEDLKYEFY